ncbi:Flp pilus assembly protein CpaB [Burkholderia orbicola]|uniref:Flp pilus assembly protein CpaB n=1 Tax=Burkholderia orbicola TaxID=2978683 RepID=A0ABT8P300_9BURK|nr:Flp pilus assembly protein CpaB [Burkholderia orbicola]MDN7528227.1 Flp pilus assembly protein CpaB [Burkholderia orbicola]
MIFNRINYRSLFANTWLLVAIAIATAGGITWMTYGYITASEARIKAETRHPARGVSVVVPRTDAPAGTPLASDMFVARDIPADLVYDDMLRADDFNRFRLATLVKAVRRGRPLRARDIDALRARDFSDILPAGTRALTLQIDTVNSTDSMLRPGNRVDLYWIGKNPDSTTRNGSDEGGAQSILLLMPDVLVLATGNDVRPRDSGEAARDMADGAQRENYSTVTLQVPVAEAARIVLAQQVGTLRLILRNSEDGAEPPPKRLDEPRLFAAASSGAVAEGDVVEIITGGNGSATTSRIAAAPADVDVPASAPALAPQSKAAARPRAASSAYQQANALAHRLQAEADVAAAPR